MSRATGEISTDRIVIVGAGIGALYAALKLAPRPVLVISPDQLGRGASSVWAQGGVAASMGETDSAEQHTQDTLRAGAGIVDAGVATKVTQEAKDHILDLTTLGTPFDRDSSGRYLLSREAAHSLARVVRVKGDQSGREIMNALIEKVRQTASIQVLEGVLALGLEALDGQITGIWLESAAEGMPSQPVLLKCPAILLAGGGSAGLYELTTNPQRIRGQVIGMAARAGVVIADAEFVQFHPTAIDVGEDPAPLATEALRGEGATLINIRGERFMEAQHPDAELAPRDIVARAVYAQTQSGLRPMLDARAVLAEVGADRFPAVTDACVRAGIDPLLQPIPVAAAAHYHMGGIEVDLAGRTSLQNLWACGEVSSTGLHGANRLASNGLLEALVFAGACANDIGIFVQDLPAARNEVVQIDFQLKDPVQDTKLISQLRSIMTDKVGVVRNAAGLRDALRRIAMLEAASAADNQTFHNMTTTATLIAGAALLRQESRGSHFRDDFPEPKKEFAKRSRLTWRDALKLRNQVSLEEN